MPVLTRSARAAAQRTSINPRRSDRIAFRQYEAYIRNMIDSYNSVRNDPRQYEILVVRNLLNTMNDTHNIEHRKIIAYMMFRFLSINTFLVLTEDRFRDAVRIKISEMTEELHMNVYIHSANTDKLHKALMSLEEVLSNL
jgi:hypothetical protein